MSEDRSLAGSDPLLPFLPLLYVGWADGHLDSEELRAIFRRALDVWKMGPADRRLVGRLLNPDRRPSRRELDEILERIRAASQGLPESDRRSLSELGLALARVSGGVSDEERAALRNLEAAVGGSGSPAAREALTAAPARPAE